MKTLQIFLATSLALLHASLAFVLAPPRSASRQSTLLYAEEGAAGPLVSGEELEMILTELDKPLVIDAYATWSVYY
jgi:hypothetical protein